MLHITSGNNVTADACAFIAQLTHHKHRHITLSICRSNFESHFSYFPFSYCLAKRRSESIHDLLDFKKRFSQKIKMFRFAILFALLTLGWAEFCYNDVENACSSRPSTSEGDGLILSNCNAKYGSFDNLQAELQAYANGHIETSFEFLLMSTHFGNYESNRDGFKGLYRKLSDTAWEKAIDLIKFIAKRGGKMNFNQLPHFKKNGKESRVLELNEFNSLAKALDSEKQLAEEALRIHAQTLNHPKQDASVAHYLEEEFMEPQAEIVRTLAGHTNDLKSLLNRDAPLSVFLFDEYLKKTL